MAKRLKWLALSLLAILLVLPSGVLAVKPDAVSDTLSDSRKSVAAKHSVVINMSAVTAFEASDTVIITLPNGFTVPAFTPTDVSINDGTTRNILATCVAGTDNVSLSVSGQIVTLTACSGFTASSSGAVISIILGTSSTLVTNPSTAGLYSVTFAGSYGDDSRSATIAVTEGVSVSLTIPFPNGDVRFTGDAFPGALVTILDNGVVAGNTVANSSSFFDKTITGLTPNVHTFSLYGQAADGRKTLTISFDINVTAGSTVTVSGILLPAILTVPDRHKRPAVLIESGLAKNNATVTTITNSHLTVTRQTTVNNGGDWSVSIPEILHIGSHTATAVVTTSGGGQSNQVSQDFQVILSADLNVDDLVNLTDFSILMFSYAISPPPNLASDINDNGPVDLVDFSVMMFYWTR